MPGLCSDWFCPGVVLLGLDDEVIPESDECGRWWGVRIDW